MTAPAAAQTPPPIPTLDARRTIPERLATIGVSASFLGELHGLSRKTMSVLLSGEQSLSNERIREFDETIKKLERVVEMSPFPVLFQDAKRVGELLGIVAKLSPEETATLEAGMNVLRNAKS